MNDLDANFVGKIAFLQNRLDSLVNAEPRKIGDRWPKEKISGVYLLSENSLPIYVGRSKNIKQRYQAHKSNSHYSASFAFLIAREETGMIANYRANEGRSALMQNEHFSGAFHRARQRISNMDFRYVVEDDPVTQCLLEVYCAVALKTERYNKFETH